MSQFQMLKRAHMEWFERLPAQVSFSGTARQCRWHGDVREWLTVEAFDGNIRHVIKTVSRDLFGKSGCRRGQRIRYCGVIEGEPAGLVTRLHCHLAIGGVPDGYPLERFQDALEYHWSWSPWGYGEVRSAAIATPDDKERWNTYMLKEFHPARAERWITNLQYE